MIRHEDAEFHADGAAIENWTETQFMIFSVPGQAISGSVYVLMRPNLGICHASIYIAQGMCFEPWEIAYADPQMHMACPARFSHLQLRNGLEIEARTPLSNYRYSYRGVAGVCAFDLDFRALMHPFDTHDPAENVSLAQTATVAEATAFGDGWVNGHFDMLGRITGSLTLYGKTFAVDCIDGMDRSWGPRSEANVPGVTWLHVTLGEDFGIHLVLSLAFVEKQVVYGPFRFGYLIDNGERHGIVAAQVTAQRTGMLATRIAMTITDDRGRTYDVAGTAIAAAPWYHFTPSNVSYQTLFRFECNGRVGYSHVADVFGLNFMAQGMRAPGTR